MVFARAQRSLIGDWWWTIDRSLLAALCGLMVIGLVMLMGGGPPVASRIGLPTFHFVERQALFLFCRRCCRWSSSPSSIARLIRRAALLVYIVGMALVIAAIQYGPEIKGAHRWYISLMGVSIQPSEFVKPAFVNPHRLGLLGSGSPARPARSLDRLRAPAPDDHTADPGSLISARPC